MTTKPHPRWIAVLSLIRRSPLDEEDVAPFFDVGAQRLDLSALRRASRYWMDEELLIVEAIDGLWSADWQKVVAALMKAQILGFWACYTAIHIAMVVYVAPELVDA